VRRVADGIAFPNGMAVTPDNSRLIIAESFAARLTAFDIDPDGGLSNRRVWADGVGPDGICMDAEGAIWTGVGDLGENLVGRVREGGEVLERVRLDMPCFACMLGGEDGKTLFMLAADWRMAATPADNITRLTRGPRTGQLLTAPGPHTGRRLAVADNPDVSCSLLVRASKRATGDRRADAPGDRPSRASLARSRDTWLSRRAAASRLRRARLGRSSTCHARRRRDCAGQARRIGRLGRARR
jgi:SMP-30/Gluconolactonase/LRE-like region